LTDEKIEKIRKIDQMAEISFNLVEFS